MSKKKQEMPFEWSNRWEVISGDDLSAIKRSYAGHYVMFGESNKSTDRPFADAIKAHNDHPPYLVWTGNNLRIAETHDEARKLCTGAKAVIFKPYHVVENEQKQVSWTETKEKILEQ